jgi:hypothetical protein
MYCNYWDFTLSMFDCSRSLNFYVRVTLSTSSRAGNQTCRDAVDIKSMLGKSADTLSPIQRFCSFNLLYRQKV